MAEAAETDAKLSASSAETLAQVDAEARDPAEEASKGARKAIAATIVARAAAKAAAAAAASQNHEEAKKATEEARKATDDALRGARDALQAQKDAAARKAANDNNPPPALSPQQQQQQSTSSISNTPPALPPQQQQQSDVNYFTKSWETKNNWYNIGVSNDTNVKTIIGIQETMSTRNLVSRPVTGAILSFKSDVDYFDYADAKFETIGKFTDTNYKSSKAEKEIKLAGDLGVIGNSAKPLSVVSLLSEKGTTFLGICFSICKSSDINRPFDIKNNTTTVMGKVYTFLGRTKSSESQLNEKEAKKQLEKDTRLICGKNTQSGKGVKILFFRDHDLGYIFFDGDVKFDSDGKFTGLDNGTLLRKVKGNGNTNAYQVLKGTFQGNTVTPGTVNEFFQYEYDSTKPKPLSATGYAAGNVEWNFQNPLPPNNMKNPNITFLNWNFGPVTVKEEKVDEDEDHGGSKCDSMYYTSHSFNSNQFITDALGSNIPANPKIEFIKKEKYTDFFDKIDITLLQLKFEATDGFYIIELAMKNHTYELERVRIYKTYSEAYSPYTDEPERTIKRHGLFIGLEPGSNYDIQFVSFFDLDQIGHVTGIRYKQEDKKSGKPKRIEKLASFPRNYLSKGGKYFEEYKIDRCSVTDTFTKQSFDSSLGAADKSYNLFFDKDGLVSMLLEQYLTPTTAGTPQDSIKEKLLKEVTKIRETVVDNLKKAMSFVESFEKAESYVDSVRKSGFKSFFTPQKSVPSLPAAAPAAPSTLTIAKKSLNEHLDNTGFNLRTAADISSTSSTQNFTYKSQNPSIAYVDPNGYVTLRKDGRVNITVSDGTNTEIVTLLVFQQPSGTPPASPAPAPASPAAAPVLEEGCIATYNGKKVLVVRIDNNGDIVIKNKDRRYEYVLDNNDLTLIMSKTDVDHEMSTNKKTIDHLLSGGKGRRRRSTRKYKKRRGRGNGNNGRRRLTRKVKGQSGGGGGARRGGKIHRKTKKRGRGGRRGRRGHRRTIKKYHSI
jgi:hypothetical protein